MPRKAYFNRTRVFSQRVADTLNDDTDIMRGVAASGLDYFGVSTGPGHGGWTMGEHEEDAKWSEPLWNCYQAIAKVLLAMPLPTKE